MKADKALLEKASAWLAEHESEFLQDLSDLVSVPSVSSAPEGEAPYGKECLRVLKMALEKAKGYGFRPEIYGNRVGSAERPGKGGKTVGFWSHLDVVPEGTGWERPPYQLIREGDLVFGRGVSDNKGPAVTMLYVLRLLDAMGMELKNTVRLFFGTDEEQGMSDVIWYRENYPTPDLNLIPDSAFPVCVAEKGILTVELVSDKPLSPVIAQLQGGLVSNMVPEKAKAVLPENAVVLEKLRGLSSPFEIQRAPGKINIVATGKAAHAAGPYEGINAVRLMTDMLVRTGIATGSDAEILEFLSAVNADCDGTALGIACEEELTGRLTCVGSVLTMKEGIPRLKLNIRYPVCKTGEELVASVAAACEKAGYHVENADDSLPNRFPEEHPLVGALTGIYNQLTGEDAGTYTMGGGTYARKLPNAFAFGPGGLPRPENLPPMGGAHQHDEGNYFPDYAKAALIYFASILELDDLI